MIIILTIILNHAAQLLSSDQEGHDRYYRRKNIQLIDMSEKRKAPGKKEKRREEKHLHHRDLASFAVLLVLTHD